MTRLFTVFICALALSLLVIPTVYAQDENADTETAPAAIGTVAETEGAVTIEQNGQLTEAAVGQDVYLGDIMETGVDSKAMILFIDETELTVGENAKMTIDDYVFDVDTPETNKGRFSIPRGPFIFVTGLIDKNDKPDVEIQTAYGSIGIRGTVVWGGDIDDEYNVFVQEGEVTFANERGSVRVGKGQGTKIGGRRAIPERAKAWGQDKIDRATRSVALKNREAVKQRLAQMKTRHKEMREHHRKAMGDRIGKKREMQEKRHEELKGKREEFREKREEHKTQRHETQRQEEIKQRHENSQKNRADTLKERHERRQRTQQQRAPAGFR